MENLLTEEQIAECKKAFSSFDTNGDGVITREEFADILDSFGQSPSTEELTELVTEIDSNGNGTIEFDEFLNMMIKKMQLKAKEELEDSFRSYDTDKDGYITGNEVKLILQSLYSNFSVEKINEITTQAGFEEAEVKVSFRDLIEMMKPHETNQQHADTDMFLYGRK